MGGSNPRIDNAIAKIDAMNQYLRQGMNESETLENSVKRLKALLN